MIRIFNSSNVDIREVLKREPEAASPEVEAVVDEIIGAVRAKGDAAVLSYVQKFDGVSLESLKVTQEEIDEAYSSVDPYFLETLQIAHRNIFDFHQKQVRKDFIVNEQRGVVLGQKITAVDRAGLYVPGGTASYPSSVLMNAVPAKIASVSEIVITTPPQKDGKIDPHILAAAKLAGVNSIFKTGGAAAIAALAYGTESIPKVDKIVGPGNIYVATAKQKVFGLVSIDMIAGPSEILVIADNKASPRLVAADLLGQAEHDRLSASILVCLNEDFAKRVAEEIELQLPLLPREEIARASIENRGMILIVDSLQEAVDISNIIAPEHLELCVDEPFGLLESVKHAGSIFMGNYTPESLGDYIAGPNHTLPTSGTARFSSPLSVDDFIKKSSFIYYTKEALEGVADRVVDFANREGLHAHGRSISLRLEEE